MSWHFLQCPTVPIRITEVDILYTPQIDNLTHFNAPACERFAGLVDVRYDQMQPLDRSRPHCRNFAHTGPNDDRTSRSGWCELDHSHSVPRLDIMVCVKSDLFNVKYPGAVNIRNWYRHQFKFHIHLYSCSFDPGYQDCRENRGIITQAQGGSLISNGKLLGLLQADDLSRRIPD